MNKENKKQKFYLGIILIGGGSSWYQDDEIGKVAVKAARQCKRDWKHLFKLKGHVFTVNVYDISNLEDGWSFDLWNGMRCNKTDQEIKLLKHSKHHTAKHIRAMVRSMKEGKTFTESHKIAQKKVGK